MSHMFAVTRLAMKAQRFAVVSWRRTAAYSAEKLLEVRMEATCTRIATGSPSKVLGSVSCQAFEGFNIASNDGRTSLIADFDQAALYGVLIRIQSLGLELIELARIPSELG